MRTHAQARRPASPLGGPARWARAPKSPLANASQVQEVLHGPRFQAKLTVGAPDDAYEREADRVADAVMRMPAPEGHIHRMCSSCEKDIQRKSLEEEPEEDVLQAQEAPGETPQVMPEIEKRIDALRGSGEPLPPSERTFFESRFGSDFANVRTHAGSEAADLAKCVHARAFTLGQSVIFGQGEYRPGTEIGRRLMAHELTHVVQQNGLEGAIDSSESRKLRAHELAHVVQHKGGATGEVIIQRRRVPESAGLAASVPAGALGLGSARTGLARVLSRAWGGLTAAQKTAVRTAASGLGLTWTTEADLLSELRTATRAQLLSFAAAIRTAAPNAELGDPLLIDTGARPATADTTNISTLVANANSVFATITSGANDSDVSQVFGAANIATAKGKYSAAHTRLNQLRAANRIVTDRSGYSAEVGLGGLSNSAQISVDPSTIDNPADNESVVTLIHESMHAGNSDVHDFGYIEQPSFTALPASVKLTNAAHFEVVARRILGASHAFVGQTFIPAGTTVGGVTAPSLTPREQAIRGASETFRAAWTAGLNLHSLFVQVFRTSAEWNTLDLSTAFSGAPAGVHFADALPFWSKVEALTIHARTAAINPAGGAAVRPVTLIDIALSEGLVRKLSQGMDRVPQTATDAATFETAHASAAERTAAAASVNAERDLLIRLVVRTHLGSLTGAVNRDVRVVARLAQAGSVADYSDILAVRPPSAFP